MRTKEKQLKASPALVSALHHIEDDQRIIISNAEAVVFGNWMASVLDFVVESICSALTRLKLLNVAIVAHPVVDTNHIMDFIGHHKEAMRRFFDKRRQVDNPMLDASFEARSVELAMLIWPFLWKTLVSCTERAYVS
jgi:hypothetical protein